MGGGAQDMASPRALPRIAPFFFFFFFHDIFGGPVFLVFDQLGTRFIVPLSLCPWKLSIAVPCFQPVPRDMEETSTGKARTTVDPEETLDSMVVAAPVEPDTAQTCSGPPNNSVKEPEDYSVDFRSWFDCLREVTFTTHFLALRSQELRALATFYDAFFPFYFRALQRHEKDTPVAEPTMSWLECKILRASCGEEHMQALDALAARIDDFLTNGGFTAPENLFCKVCVKKHIEMNATTR